MLLSLNKERDDLLQQINYVSQTSSSIKSLSEHARVQCRAKMSKFIEIDALMNTSEYKLKYADNSIVSSVKMTVEYCDKSVEGLNEEVKALDDYIDRIKEQQMLAVGVTGGGMTKDVKNIDNATLTYYENGLVDIVESDNEPIVRNVERKAKFKTKDERDEYFRRIKLEEEEKET